MLLDWQDDEEWTIERISCKIYIYVFCEEIKRSFFVPVCSQSHKSIVALCVTVEASSSDRSIVEKDADLDFIIANLLVGWNRANWPWNYRMILSLDDDVLDTDKFIVVFYSVQCFLSEFLGWRIFRRPRSYARYTHTYGIGHLHCRFAMEICIQHQLQFRWVIMGGK